MPIQVNSILRLNPASSRFEFINRWLDCDPTELPMPDEIFRLRVVLRLEDNDYYLQEDGTFGTAGAEHVIPVQTRKFAMIDPPRTDQPVEPEATGQVVSVQQADSFNGSPNLESTDRFYVSRVLRFTSGALTDEKQIIAEYSGESRQLIFAGEWPQPPMAGDTFEIDPPGYFAVGRRPTMPVNCMLPTNSPLPEGVGLGICNLLRSNRRFVRETAQSLVERQIEKSIARIPVTTSSRDLRKESEVIAISLSSFLIEQEFRPMRLRPLVRDAYAELIELTERTRQSQFRALSRLAYVFPDSIIDPQFGSALRTLTSRGPLPAILRSDDQLMGVWELMALLVEMIYEEEFLTALERTIYDSQQARNFLSIRALQGGRLIDFWCSPDRHVDVCDDASRGKQYSAPELIALGRTIGSFTESDLDDWLRDAESSITISVENDRLGSGTRVLDNAAIRRARMELTSSNVVPPDVVHPPRLNFDLLQSNVEDPDRITRGSESESTHVRHVTGDGIVQILMRGEEVSSGQEPLYAGFNVYCMWEDASTQRYFDDPSLNPDLPTIRRWLVTRRYSMSRDLTALPVAAIEHANQEPPDEPVFFRPTEAYDFGPINNQEYDGFPIPADLQNPGSQVFSFDLRRGLDFTDGWDPRGEIATQWSPELKRDGNRVTALPQGYRFWVTTIDFFGQESDPVPVRTDDPASRLSPEYIYRPVYRTPLPAPTRNGSAAEPILRYDADTIATVNDTAAMQSQFSTAIEGLTDVTDFYNGRLVEFRTGALAGEAPREISWYEIINETSCRFTFTTPWPSVPALGDELVIRSPQVITINWETPFIAPIGRRDSDDRVRVPSSDLVSYVVIYRKRVETPSEPSRTAPLDSLPNVPQWERTSETMRQQGFVQFREVIRVDGAYVTDNLWSTSISDLEHIDKGFEYLAAISVELKAGPAAFWAPNVIASDSDPTGCEQGTNRTGRCVQRIQSVLVSGNDPARYSYELAYQVISETPRHSDIAFTAKVTASNVEEPRGVELDSLTSRFEFALPVLPASGIKRDAVLTRLLSRSFVDDRGAPIPKQEYRDTAVELTVGQAAMIDTALIRSNADPEASDLAIARELMAGDLEYRQPQNNSDVLDTRNTTDFQPQASQNRTIGFRGLIKLTWDYISLEQRASSVDESEAVGFRIDEARIPINDSEPKSSANVSAQGTLQNASNDEILRYRLTPLSDDQQITDLSNVVRNKKSALVRIESVNETHFGVVVGASAGPGPITQAELEIQLNRPAMAPTNGTVHVYFANELTQLGIQDQQVVLPVGGGVAEIYCWWVTTSGTNGGQAGFNRRAYVIREFVQTVEPSPPALVSVLPPANDLFHRLDRDNDDHRPWLPTDLLSSVFDLVRIAPHLVVSWQPSETPNIGVAIHREDNLIEERERKRLLSGNADVWQAMRNVQNLAVGEPVVDTDLDLMVNGNTSGDEMWLVGDPVTDKTNTESEQFNIGFASPGESGFLSGSTGIKLLPAPGNELVVVDSPTDPTENSFLAKNGLPQDGVYNSYEVVFLDGRLRNQTNTVVSHTVDASGNSELIFQSPWQYPPEPGDRFVVKHLAGFIDYFRFWNDPALAMTVDYRHSYQIYQYLDLCNGMPEEMVAGIPEASRFLRSEPTRTLAGIPQTATITINPATDQNAVPDPGLLGPKVVLRIAIEDFGLLKARADVESWRYRVLARRKRFFSLPSSPGLPAETGFEDVGNPVSIVPGSTTAEIVDINLERPAIREGMTLSYEIAVSQFAVMEDGQERLIRTPAVSQLFDVIVPELRPQEDDLCITKIIEVT